MALQMPPSRFATARAALVSLSELQRRVPSQRVAKRGQTIKVHAACQRIGAAIERFELRGYKLDVGRLTFRNLRPFLVCLLWNSIEGTEHRLHAYGVHRHHPSIRKYADR